MSNNFIVYQQERFGFVARGFGSGVNNVHLYGMPLIQVLEETRIKLMKFADEVNGYWLKLNHLDPQDPQNIPIMERLLYVGAWAYSHSIDLCPLQEACVYGPTNPLRANFIDYLELLYSRCWSAVHLFGNQEQRIIALRCLTNDFEFNGGLDLKTGGVGYGFIATLYHQYKGHFRSRKDVPDHYLRFGELIEHYAKLVTTKYPGVQFVFANFIKTMIESVDGGFGSNIEAPGRSVLLKKLQEIYGSLLVVGEPANTASTS